LADLLRDHLLDLVEHVVAKFAERLAYDLDSFELALRADETLLTVRPVQLASSPRARWAVSERRKLQTRSQ
jgi:hypothetical protein